MGKIINLDEERRNPLDINIADEETLRENVMDAVMNESNYSVVARSSDFIQKNAPPIMEKCGIRFYVKVNTKNFNIYAKFTKKAVDTAIANTIKNARIASLADLLSNMENNDRLALSTLDEWEPEDGMFYCLTNTTAEDGAGVIAFDEVLKKVYSKCGAFYLVPSSIHEVMIVPEKENFEIDMLKEMLQEINYAVVLPKDQLSDQVLYYDGKSLK